MHFLLLPQIKELEAPRVPWAGRLKIFAWSCKNHFLQPRKPGLMAGFWDGGVWEWLDDGSSPWKILVVVTTLSPGSIPSNPPLDDVVVMWTPVRPNSNFAEFRTSVVLMHNCYVLLGLNWPWDPSLIPCSDWISNCLEFQLSPQTWGKIGLGIPTIFPLKLRLKGNQLVKSKTYTIHIKQPKNLWYHMRKLQRSVWLA